MKQRVAHTPGPSDIRFELVRWAIFSILILTYILVYFHRMAPGVVSEYLMADFGISGARLGSLAAVYFAVYAVMQIPSGVIADTLGTRTSIIFGNLVAGTGSILFGLAPGFEIALAGRFLVGLGVSVVFIAIMKNNAVWFHEKVFGIMSGLTLFFGNLGGVLAAGPLAQVLTVFQWRTVFTGIGALSLILGLAGFVLVRNKPQDMGFDPPQHLWRPPGHPHPPLGDQSQKCGHDFADLARILGPAGDDRQQLCLYGTVGCPVSAGCLSVKPGGFRQPDDGPAAQLCFGALFWDGSPTNRQTKPF